MVLSNSPATICKNSCWFRSRVWTYIAGQTKMLVFEIPKSSVESSLWSSSSEDFNKSLTEESKGEPLCSVFFFAEEHCSEFWAAELHCSDFRRFDGRLGLPLKVWSRFFIGTLLQVIRVLDEFLLNERGDHFQGSVALRNPQSLS